MHPEQKHHHKASHPLRLTLFFLRLAVGLNFFYLGFGTLFDKALLNSLTGSPLGGLYSWLSSSSAIPWGHPVAPLIFIAIGTCLILGLAARIVSLLGILMIIWEYFPMINFSHASALVALNDQFIMLLCLLVLFFGKAGSYLGMDRFFHFSVRGKK